VAVAAGVGVGVAVGVALGVAEQSGETVVVLVDSRDVAETTPAPAATKRPLTPITATPAYRRVSRPLLLLVTGTLPGNAEAVAFV
jgi:hypothetical protein